MQISYPRAGCVRISNVSFLSTPDHAECRRFVATLFHLPEVGSVEISTTRSMVDICFQTPISSRQIGRQLGALTVANGSGPKLPVLKADSKGLVRLSRHGSTISTWSVASDIPGRIRVRNSRLFRKKRLCHEVERELMTVLGIERFKVNPMTCSVLIYYDPKAIDKEQLLEFLDETLHNAEEHPSTDKHNHELLLCTATMGLAAVAQFTFPVLLLPVAALFIYTVYPSFVAARETLLKERRLGVDVLDAIVAVMCLISAEIFAGAVLAWCLSFGRTLLSRAQEDSRRRLVNVFGKQPRTAWLHVDGIETQVSLERIKTGDIIAVHTGEAIAADGLVWEGNALVDQHALTGESVPVEKEVGSRVYASTLVIGGKLLIQVERAGKETTTAKISAILNETAAFRLTSQSKGEAMADKAVIPTLGLASLGLATVGLPGATAIINCDFGTGIRMAAPLALLSSLSVCSSRGILVKDGRALEQMDIIDTVLFDKTGTLTHERPEVCRLHRFGKIDEAHVLMYAAAAERRLEHPIAAAIVEKFRALEQPWPQTDHSSYKVGYGISVHVGSRHVLVGSSRFMKIEKIDVSDEVRHIEQEAHAEGHSIVFVAVDHEVAGAIELAPRLRSGVREVIAGLRERGVRQVVIISGDHERPTRKLAEELGVDRYFAEVLPEDKAKYVELLQKEGRKVCFVGDGINDSIALKRANVSVSMRGATTVATDTSQIVFMEDNLWKLCEFRDISRHLDNNVKLSWQIILVPNLLCIAGAFFLGFGVMASVLANNVAAIAALANGLRPRGMYAGQGSQLTVRKKSFFGRLASLLVSFLQRRRSSPKQTILPPVEADRMAVLLPSRKSFNRTAGFFMLAGLAGAVLPGMPGWPLLIVSITMFAAKKPAGSFLNRWLTATFPTARAQALRFGYSLVSDLQRRYPETAPLALPPPSIENFPEVKTA
jgi:heavy metal translocating P-type ATPase